MPFEGHAAPPRPVLVCLCDRHWCQLSRETLWHRADLFEDGVSKDGDGKAAVTAMCATLSRWLERGESAPVDAPIDARARSWIDNVIALLIRALKRGLSHDIAPIIDTVAFEDFAVAYPAVAEMIRDFVAAKEAFHQDEREAIEQILRSVRFGFWVETLKAQFDAREEWANAYRHGPLSLTESLRVAAWSLVSPGKKVPALDGEKCRIRHRAAVQFGELVRSSRRNLADLDEISGAFELVARHRPLVQRGKELAWQLGETRAEICRDHALDPTTGGD